MALPGAAGALVTPERWRHVKEVLDAALGRPAGDRAAFVAHACGDDAELRAEVASLMAFDDEANRFLETPAGPRIIGPLAETRPAVAAGARIGPYRVTTEIAHGGMGAVYLAERDDQEYHKRVAIKLVRRDVDSASVVRRFRQERQILADLDHPNVPRLLDGGSTEDGLPYFVMEHVEGVPIDGYCEKGGLSVPQRLELFRTACSAVASAHAKGVLHRDLKPANILVSPDGTPKLLDFGIAKLLRLAGDLDAIVLKALRKEPDRRYRSVAQLSEDIRRHLDGRPVTARKDRVAYRAGRFMRRNRAAALGALTVAGFAALVSALVYRWVAGTDAPATPAITSLAVLPLANLSQDREQDYFADGMTEALIADLSRIGSLRVVSRTSVTRYVGAKTSRPEIARELKVDGVVEGSVLRTGDRVRITAQLIRAADGRRLWAESYEREMRDIVALQGAVAHDIAGRVKGHLTARSPAAAAGLASHYAYLGEKDEAMRWLEKGYEARSGTLLWINMNPQDPHDAYASLRSDPRFQDLLRRVGLP
jgi:TolB-like protein/tRNA A-37 threonylcarbamoyl transferase component Bud32